MKMRRFVLLIGIVILAGCGSKPSLVGTWTLPVPDVGTVKATFAEDKSLHVEGSYQGFNLSADGTYELKDTSLTLTPTKYTLPKEVPEFMKSAAMDAFKKKLAPITVTIEWVDENEVKITPPSNGTGFLTKPVSMNRVPK
jgi:hypothetical protein